MGRWRSDALATATLAASFLLAGCRPGMGLIDRVTFKPSDNLETVRVSLVFTKKVKTDLAGGFLLKDYGFLFVNPYTPAEAFEIGFALDTGIFDEQDYVSLEPVSVLPNGLPIGLDHALAEARSPAPISSKFDLYGYVDVLHASWLGVAALFGFVDDRYFPNDLLLSQVFLRDKERRPGVVATVFGPSVNLDGSVRRAGGIALFANVRQLLDGLAASGARELTLRPEPLPIVSGPGAARLEGKYGRIQALEAGLVRAFNRR